MADPKAIALPEWAAAWVEPHVALASDEERMRLAIALAQRNVAESTGGPFGAVIVEVESGRIVSVGLNSVVRLNNSSLHAEMVAFMRAQARVGQYSLAAPGLPSHALYSSCDPCAMCLGAALWAGVSHIVAAARRDDAVNLRFDEGPVFPESFAYLRRRGIAIRHGFLREEAVAVLEAYRAQGGIIYNR